MPKPRILQKYDVDESRCILCGICVDACPYDALRDGADFELAHTSRVEPQIDLLALAMVDRETEMTYIRRENDWATRAIAEGRSSAPRMLPVLPASIAVGSIAGGNGHPGGNGNGHGHAGHTHAPALGPGGDPGQPAGHH